MSGEAVLFLAGLVLAAAFILLLIDAVRIRRLEARMDALERGRQARTHFDTSVRDAVARRRPAASER